MKTILRSKNNAKIVNYIIYQNHIINIIKNKDCVKNEFIMVLCCNHFSYGIIQQSTHSTWQTWVAHELMEAGFHFIIVSMVFLNPTIGLLAALIHFVIDVSHTILIRDMGEIEHRALHFLVESLFFILIYGL